METIQQCFNFPINQAIEMLLIRSLFLTHLTFAKHHQSIRKSRNRVTKRRAGVTDRHAHSMVRVLGVRGTGSHDDGWLKDDYCVPESVKHRATLTSRGMAKEAEEKEEDEEMKTEVMDEDEKGKEEKVHRSRKKRRR